MTTAQGRHFHSIKHSLSMYVSKDTIYLNESQPTDASDVCSTIILMTTNKWYELVAHGVDNCVNERINSIPPWRWTRGWCEYYQHLVFITNMLLFFSTLYNVYERTNIIQIPASNQPARPNNWSWSCETQRDCCLFIFIHQILIDWLMIPSESKNMCGRTIGRRSICE